MDKKKKVLISFDTVRPGFEELAEWADMTRRPEGESLSLIHIFADVVLTSLLFM